MLVLSSPVDFRIPGDTCRLMTCLTYMLLFYKYRKMRWSLFAKYFQLSDIKSQLATKYLQSGISKTLNK